MLAKRAYDRDRGHINLPGDPPEPFDLVIKLSDATTADRPQSMIAVVQDVFDAQNPGLTCAGRARPSERRSNWGRRGLRVIVLHGVQEASTSRKPHIGYQRSPTRRRLSHSRLPTCDTWNRRFDPCRSSCKAPRSPRSPSPTRS